MLSVTKGVLNLRQWGCRLRSSHHFKESVIAHLSRFEALKIYGAKHITDTPEALARAFW